MTGGPSTQVKAKKGYQKIVQTCRIAASEGIDYAWVDTCCIDKSSSAELSEAINSMFKWYQRAKVCYAHLADLAPNVLEENGFDDCKWFTRGWTLQELLASRELVFYDANWGRRSTKLDVVDTVSRVTGILPDVIRDPILLHQGNINVATKMSWASSRVTTRVEDMAYCLLGLFDINMPVLYGEGPKAFMRLQDEIIKKTNDLSLLAWTRDAIDAERIFTGILAPSPAVFRTLPCP